MNTAVQDVDFFKNELESTAGMKLKLRINNNRSTMLSVRWETNHTAVSLHRMFLEAPNNIMEALACYIRGDHKIIAPTVRSYIEDNLRKEHYSHPIKLGTIVTKGVMYDLQQMYDEINREYFDDKLRLSITWFGKHRQKNRSRITFGLYHEPLRLVKIHRILDDYTIPDYVVYYVIYHEMVHHVCPSYVDEKGLHRIHNEAFKIQENKFKNLQPALDWINENKERLFAKLN